MKTQLSNSQRRAPRDHVSAIGVSKSPEFLTVLSEIEDTNDFDLLTTCVVASVFDHQTRGKQPIFGRMVGLPN
jgi:hypothetical protein